MTLDTDLATLREALNDAIQNRTYGAIVEHDPMCASLIGERPCNCTVRNTIQFFENHHWKARAEAAVDALDRVETELAQLRERANFADAYKYRQRAETAERELARLQEGLHGIEARLPVDDDPYDGTANGVIRCMIRALLAENHTAAPNQAPVPGPNPKETEQSASSPQPSQQPPSSPSPAPQRRNRAT